MSITASLGHGIFANTPTDTAQFDPVAVPLRALVSSADPAVAAAKRQALSQALHQGALDIQMQRE